MSTTKRIVPISIKSPLTRDVPVGNSVSPKAEVVVRTKGEVPSGGYEGQVLTKQKTSYLWSDNPIRVEREEELPESPSRHALYLIEDTNRLMKWDGENWSQINDRYTFAYDEDEEALYLETTA